MLENQQGGSERKVLELGNTQIQREDPLKREDCRLSKYRNHVYKKNFETKADQKERKYNSNTGFYKEAWAYILLFDPDKQSYSDWRIFLNNELVSVRPGGLYWKQLTGEAKRQDMTEDQSKRWDERSQQLLSCLRHSLQGSKMFQLIKDASVVFNYTGDSWGGGTGVQDFKQRSILIIRITGNEVALSDYQLMYEGGLCTVLRLWSALGTAAYS